MKKIYYGEEIAMTGGHDPENGKITSFILEAGKARL